MRLFFVNTDAVSYDGASKHDDWIRREVVLTGGETRYKDELARIPLDARVLVYVNKVGVVAVGRVTSSEITEVHAPHTIYPTDQAEYHRPVAWLLDLRANPITWGELGALLGQGPLRAVQEVHAGKDALLHHLASLEYQEPYLESHHIATLAEGGPDTPENTAALCANCHRELHYGAERRAKTARLRALIQGKQAGPQQ